MAILRSNHKPGETKPQGKSFKELVSRICQRTQLMPPGARRQYEVEGRIQVGMLGLHLRESRLTRLALDSVRKSMRSPTVSRLPIPPTFARTIYATKSSGRFWNRTVDTQALQRRRHSSLT
jgi:hypothetical protein